MDYLAVAAAGFLGAVSRGFISNLIKPDFAGHFPLSTLMVNLTGCFILSLFMSLTLSRLIINSRLRLAIATGFLGAYTTFSTFSLEAVNLVRSGPGWLALGYILATPLGCILAAWLGDVLSRMAGKGRGENIKILE